MKHHPETRVQKSGFVHSRINKDIKEQASYILEKIGLNVSDAIRLFLNQVVMRKGLPFPVCIPNSETIEALESADRGEDLEEVTLAQLHEQFQNERKKLRVGKRKKSK
jgi:DNA-damage-inducible protein J